MLLSPRKLPAWLNEAGAEAERQLIAVEAEDDRTKSPTPSEGPVVDEAQ